MKNKTLSEKIAIFLVILTTPLMFIGGFCVKYLDEPYMTKIICNKKTNFCHIEQSNIRYGKYSEFKFTINDILNTHICDNNNKFSLGTSKGRLYEQYKIKNNHICHYKYMFRCKNDIKVIEKNIKNLPEINDTVVFTKWF